MNPLNTTQKLLNLLPLNWFSDTAKSVGGVLYTVLSSFGVGIDYLTSASQYVILQTRINTATGQNLDNIANDFFGSRIQRFSGQPDSSFRQVILNEILRIRCTRQGIIKAVNDLGCTVVETFEEWRDGFYTDAGYSDYARSSDINPYTGILFIQRPLGPANTLLFYTDYNYSDYNYLIDQSSPIWTIPDQVIFNTVMANKVEGTEVFLVLDPVPLTAENGPNRCGISRYYRPPLNPGNSGWDYQQWGNSNWS